jgi:signal transduction histidine kinase
LGLAVVRSLLEAHGGEIDLLAGTGGAHFRLSLPAAA